MVVRSPNGRPPAPLRWLATKLVRGPETRYVLGDLDEAFERDVGRGTSRAHASVRYLRNVVHSAFSVSSARRQGGLRGDRVSERMMDRRRRFTLGISWLDVKLGLRMLVKSPLLTLTGCVAIATAIGINAGFHEFMRDMLAPVAWLEADDRIVKIANYDVAGGGEDPRLLEDLGRWRDGLETVEHIGAVLSLDMSLVGPDGHATLVDVAEMSASGFEIVGMVPELGRPLFDTDDGPGAEPVMVIGHDAWQRYLAGDPDIIGSTLRLGDTSYRVVGVAPSDFLFPMGQEMWVNFRRDPEAYPARAGPSVIVFGRLAPDRSLAEAEAEIEQFGLRAAADYPQTHARLRPSVTPFAESFGISADQIRWAIRIARTLLVMLLIVACANIATLVFARNAGRESEIAVRNALGAGRGRIVMQLFAEAMILATISTGLGLAVADWGLRYGGQILWEVQRANPPFWWDPGISLSAVLYSLGLATLGAGVVGILPALRATGRGSHATLQRTGSGGSSLAFGRLPTAVIVVQIAIAVALIPIVLAGTISEFRERFISVSFPTEDYLTARLLVDSEVQLTSTAADQAAGASGGRIISVAGVTDRFRVGPALLARYKEMRDDVAQQVRAEPGVRSFAFTSRLPGLLGQSIPATRLEVDGQPPRDRGWYVRTATAELELFDVVGRSMLSGRPFTMVDYASDQRVAIVNQAFVLRVLSGQGPVGLLVRDFDPDGDDGRPWTEIVGVVPDDVAGPGATQAQIYYPLAGVGEYPMRMLIEFDGDPAAFAPRLRAIVANAAPGVMLDEVFLLDEIRRGEVMSELFWVVALGFVALVTALLATAGVYALMSFIVSQRTREIGIRTALGADPARVVKGVFLRTFIHLGLGVVVGLAVVGVLGSMNLGFEAGGALWFAGGGVSAVLVTVGLIGCVIPVLRALRIQPTEALRADG